MFRRSRKSQLRSMVKRAGDVPASAWWAAAGLACYGGFRLAQYLRMADLRGRVVLITGGSRGLGFLLAREFACHGCRIAICGRDRSTLRRARRELERLHADTITFECDVADPDAVRGMVDAATRHFGRIDILVNNAGMIQVGPMESMRESDFHEAMEVMFWAPLRATLAVLPQMKLRGEGRIVNITSIGGVVSVPHLLPYNCAKFAAVGLSRGLRAELGRHGISVTTIIPGLMRIGSHLNAEFRGDAPREYQWFALGATLPGMSISGSRAARQIVAAVRRGESVRVLGLCARLTESFSGLMPATTDRILSLVNRAMPGLMNGHGSTMRGWEADDALESRLFHAATSAGETAAAQSNQFETRMGRNPG